MAASVCGTEADVLPTEERKYDHEMSTPLQWEQRAAAWSHQTPRIQNLAKALPLMSKGEEATFKIMVKNLCELAGPEVWRQTVDARQRSVLWHAVDVEDDAAVEILLAYGAGDDERTLQSCRALSHERNMFSIAAQLGAPISEDTFHGNVDESACCHSAMSYQGSENWSLFMRARRVPLCCAPQQDPEYLTLHFQNNEAEELSPFHVPDDVEVCGPQENNPPFMR